MTLLSILGTLFLEPLKLIFEIVFSVANSFIDNPGLAIIALSLVMNIMAFPLYQRADKMQEASRDVEAKLHKGVAHIRKTFSGDEKMMILQTYYRQNNYKPTDSLRGSISLVLEIPFFIAAYQFLSHLTILDGVSLGPIANLGAPDGLINILGQSINLLPLLMTGINIFTSTLLLKGQPAKAKIQLYGIAVIFLVLLYPSPAGLVFYWTLNNIFSLIKTIFYKLKNPRKIIYILTTIIGLAFIIMSFVYETNSMKRIVFLLAIGCMLEIPLAFQLIKKVCKRDLSIGEKENNTKIFVAGTVFLTVFIGILIPSTYIAASPQEFVDVSYFYNPLWYVLRSLCMAAGTFLIWMRVFYSLASKTGRYIFDKLIWILCGCAVINYMFFGTKLGVIAANLKYENGMYFTLKEQFLNIIILVVLAAIMLIIIRKWHKTVFMALIVVTIAICGMSTINVLKINESIGQLSAKTETTEMPSFELSKNGKNVVVIMLDRALGYQVPFIINEKPELKEKFSGFTYYENTISFGGCTNFGTPGIFGGYEYTPVEMNKRSDELLVDKHNEALKVMPKLFSDNGYAVTVCNPPYANYQWTSDISIYEDMKNVEAYVTDGIFKSDEEKQDSIGITQRNFFCFSIMKSMPIFMQPYIYNGGIYHQLASDSIENIYTKQVASSASTATGISEWFMDEYNTLENLDSMTSITDENENTFLMMANDTTHQPMLLQTPDYVPEISVNNTEYDSNNAERFTVNGRTLHVESALQMQHYHANMAALIQIGNWLDYLRENDVYDNTKIILVSDHGRILYQMDELIYEGQDVGFFNPLLMIKDFNQEGFSISSEFMTNADVPTIAAKDTIEVPVNPYTGKAITNNDKYTHKQFITLSGDWDVSINNGTTYLPSAWASVSDNIWEEKNWKFYDAQTVLKNYKEPQ